MWWVNLNQIIEQQDASPANCNGHFWARVIQKLWWVISNKGSNRIIDNCDWHLWARILTRVLWEWNGVQTIVISSVGQKIWEGLWWKRKCVSRQLKWAVLDKSSDNFSDGEESVCLDNWDLDTNWDKHCDGKENACLDNWDGNPSPPPPAPPLPPDSQVNCTNGLQKVLVHRKTSFSNFPS